MILMLDLNRYLMCGLAEIFNSIVLFLPDRTLRPPDIIVGNRGDDIDVNIPKKRINKKLNTNHANLLLQYASMQQTSRE